MNQKVYIQGNIHHIKVGMGQISLQHSLPANNTANAKPNNPVTVYDTAGPFSDPTFVHDPAVGIPAIRNDWNTKRKDITKVNDHHDFPIKAKDGKNITQLYYAKMRTVTPEMEYVAIRENQQVEALGLKSYITPEFVRKEIASGNAIIPANINHPEAEPMIIGSKFLVKVNANIVNNANFNISQYCKLGTDTVIDHSDDQDCGINRNTLIRNSPVPVGTSPILQALAYVDGNIERLDWQVFKQTLIEQAQQGVDFVAIHAAMLLKHLHHTDRRLVESGSRSGRILRRWMVEHQKENFLYEHFTELCEILKGYDVALFLASGLRPNAIYDANDHAHIAELHEMKQLIHVANKGFVQIVTEGPGHIPLHKINEHVKEHTYICKNTPFFTLGLTVTDVAGKHDYIASAIGNAQVAWLGAALISCNAINECNHNDELNNSYDDNKINDSVPNNSYDNNKQINEEVQVNDMVQNNIVAHKIAAHAADIAKGHPGAQVRDNALSKARKEGRVSDVVKLGF